MRLFIVGICVACVAAPTHAGPWTREEGQFFTATGGNFLLSDGAQLPVNYDPTFYAEYGFNDQVTLGVDYHTADQGRIQAAVVFAVFPLPVTTHRDVWSAQIGLGGRFDPLHPVEYLTRGGVSWGRGLDNGWMAVDATATYGNIDQVFRAKADITAGWHLSDRWTAIGQLQTGQGYDGDTYAKINPSLVFRLNEQYSVSLGAVQAMTGDRGSALKLDIWSTFTGPRLHARD